MFFHEDVKNTKEYQTIVDVLRLKKRPDVLLSSFQIEKVLEALDSLMQKKQIYAENKFIYFLNIMNRAQFEVEASRQELHSPESLAHSEQHWCLPEKPFFLEKSLSLDELFNPPITADPVQHALFPNDRNYQIEREFAKQFSEDREFRHRCMVLSQVGFCCFPPARAVGVAFVIYGIAEGFLENFNDYRYSENGKETKGTIFLNGCYAARDTAVDCAVDKVIGKIFGPLVKKVRENVVERFSFLTSCKVLRGRVSRIAEFSLGKCVSDVFNIKIEDISRLSIQDIAVFFPPTDDLYDDKEAFQNLFYQRSNSSVKIDAINQIHMPQIFFDIDRVSVSSPTNLSTRMSCRLSRDFFQDPHYRLSWFKNDNATPRFFPVVMKLEENVDPSFDHVNQDFKNDPSMPVVERTEVDSVEEKTQPSSTVLNPLSMPSTPIPKTTTSPTECSLRIDLINPSQSISSFFDPQFVYHSEKGMSSTSTQNPVNPDAPSYSVSLGTITNSGKWVWAPVIGLSVPLAAGGITNILIPAVVAGGIVAAGVGVAMNLYRNSRAFASLPKEKRLNFYLNESMKKIEKERNKSSSSSGGEKIRHEKNKAISMLNSLISLCKEEERNRLLSIKYALETSDRRSQKVWSGDGEERMLDKFLAYTNNLKQDVKEALNKKNVNVIFENCPKLIEFFPKEIFAYSALASAYAEKGLYRKALEKLKEASQLCEPSSKEIKMINGQIYGVLWKKVQEAPKEKRERFKEELFDWAEKEYKKNPSGEEEIGRLIQITIYDFEKNEHKDECKGESIDVRDKLIQSLENGMENRKEFFEECNKTSSHNEINKRYREMMCDLEIEKKIGEFFKENNINEARHFLESLTTVNDNKFISAIQREKNAKLLNQLTDYKQSSIEHFVSETVTFLIYQSLMPSLSQSEKGSFQRELYYVLPLIHDVVLKFVFDALRENKVKKVYLAGNEFLNGKEAEDKEIKKRRLTNKDIKFIIHAVLAVVRYFERKIETPLYYQKIGFDVARGSSRLLSWWNTAEHVYFNPYLGVPGLLISGIENFVESKRINNDMLWENPSVWVALDMLNTASIALTIFGMAKTNDVDFSAVREKLGDEVIFSLAATGAVFLTYRAISVWRNEPLRVKLHNASVLINEEKYEEALKKYQEIASSCDKGKKEDIQRQIDWLHITLSFNKEKPDYDEIISYCTKILLIDKLILIPGSNIQITWDLMRQLRKQIGMDDDAPMPYHQDILLARADAYIGKKLYIQAEKDLKYLFKDGGVLMRLANLAHQRGNIPSVIHSLDNAELYFKKEILKVDESIKDIESKRYVLGGWVDYVYGGYQSLKKDHPIIKDLLGVVINDNDFSFRIKLDKEKNKKEKLEKSLSSVTSYQEQVKKEIDECWLDVQGQAIAEGINVIADIIRVITPKNVPSSQEIQPIKPHLFPPFRKEDGESNVMKPHPLLNSSSAFFGRNKKVSDQKNHLIGSKAVQGGRGNDLFCSKRKEPMKTLPKLRF